MAKHINEQISAYIDGMMPGKEMAEFEKHINECEKCKKLLEETKKALSALHEVKDKPLPAGYLSRLSAKLDIAEGKEPRRAFNFNIYMKGLAAAAALVFVVVMTRYTLKETNNFSSISTKQSVPAKEAGWSEEQATGSKNTEPAKAAMYNKDEAKIAAKKPMAKTRSLAQLPPAMAPEEKVETEASIELDKSKTLAGANYGEAKLKSKKAETQQAADITSKESCFRTNRNDVKTKSSAAAIKTGKYSSRGYDKQTMGRNKQRADDTFQPGIQGFGVMAAIYCKQQRNKNRPP